jgi:hypothetical protein
MATDTVSVHRFSLVGLLSRYGPFVLLFGLFAAIGLALLALAIARPEGLTILPGLICLAVALVCLGGPLYGFVRRHTRVEVSPEGLRWQGPHSGSCSWNDIRTVYRTEKIINQTFRLTELKLVLTNGEVVSFNHSLTDYDRLAEAVQQQAARALLGPLRQAASSQAEFGPVMLSPDGITIQGELLPWQDIQQHTVFNGSLLVSTIKYPGWQGKFVALSEIPNYLVLLQLLDERIGVRPGTRS